MKYIYKNDKYSLISADEDIIINEIDEVAIAFSKDEEIWTLHKHGRKEYIEEWFGRIIKIYRDADIANNMVMISGKFPVEELNRCLDIAGYVKVMCKKLKLKI